MSTGAGRVALVTGGGTGIGAASAEALARSGFAVAINGRRAHVLEETASSIQERVPNAEIATFKADIGVAKEAAGLVRRVIERFERIDVLVSSAAAYEAMHFLDIDAEHWDRTMDVAVRGSALCSVEAARFMRGGGGGRIILVSSVSGTASEGVSAAYCAAKAAIDSLARSMAVDLSEHGIAVNAVAPGWVETPMVQEDLDNATPESLRRLNPLGRMGKPEEPAEVIRWLATDAPPFLTGTTIAVDGGQSAQAPNP
ncbi:MAG: SDR family oxidoreductase [Actinobacteria bacterium]|nr:SDR family oxidoreductase [Actinomycetota bacterium]